MPSWKRSRTFVNTAIPIFAVTDIPTWRSRRKARNDQGKMFMLQFLRTQAASRGKSMVGQRFCTPRLARISRRDDVAAYAACRCRDSI